MSAHGMQCAPHATTLRALARLLDYPDAALCAHLPDLLDALHAQRTLGSARLAEIDALVAHVAGAYGLDAQAEYVDVFDRGRGASLHLFEHVHGDSRERGPAMIDLLRTYEEAGLYLSSDELPDHLGVALEFASTQPADASTAFIGEIAHILAHIYGTLARRGSPYAAVFAALLDIAGVPAQPAAGPAEPGLDETWSEPAAFEGCASRGQQRADGAQPIRLVRTPVAPHSGQPAQGASS